jgi:hypothetical protein
MPGTSPITILDYARAVSQANGSGEVSFDPDDVLSHGCEICQAPLTIGSAYPARFGLLRCSQCIGDDGFVTAVELEEFRATGIISCPQCGTRMPVAEISPDGRSCWYKCPACRATAQFTIRVPA